MNRSLREPTLTRFKPKQADIQQADPTADDDALDEPLEIVFADEGNQTFHRNISTAESANTPLGTDAPTCERANP